MSELEAEFLALRVYEVCDTSQRGDLGVAPETAVFGGYATGGEDGGGFDDCEGGAAEGEGAEMDQMVVC